MQRIDISWVSLCAPLRPGKNSFVLMLGARSYVLAFWPDVIGRFRRVVLGQDRGIGWLYMPSNPF